MWNADPEDWTDDDNVNYWNGKNNGNGGRNSYWVDNGVCIVCQAVHRFDIGVVRVADSSEAEDGRVHLAPWRSGWENPEWTNHSTRFGEVVGTPGALGSTWCVAKGQDEYDPDTQEQGKQGVACGLYSGYKGAGVYGINMPTGHGAVGGDSGAPVFNQADKPRPLGFIQTSQGINGDAEFLLLTNQMLELQEESPYINDLRICSPIAYGGWEFDCP